jgi:hypothetical protein
LIHVDLIHVDLIHVDSASKDWHGDAEQAFCWELKNKKNYRIFNVSYLSCVTDNFDEDAQKGWVQNLSANFVQPIRS